MIIGVPKEIKNHEYRVGLIPAAVRAYHAKGHQILVEKGRASEAESPMSNTQLQAQNWWIVLTKFGVSPA